MSLKSDLRDLNTNLNDIGDKLDADLKRLEDKIADTPAAEDVSQEVSDLRATVERLQGLDRPDVDTLPDQSSGNTGSVVDPGNPALGGGSGTPATDSPGEPQEGEKLPEAEDKGTVENPAPQEVSEDNGENV